MEDKVKLLKYLKSHELLILSTCHTEPLACPLYYGIDDKFNFYIVTSPATEHGKNIRQNHKAACVIINTNQPMFKTKFKIGVQLKGEIKQLTKQEEIERALGFWGKNNKEIINEFMTHIRDGSWSSRPYVIKPKEIKWFNEELFGEEGTRVFMF